MERGDIRRWSIQLLARSACRLLVLACALGTALGCHALHLEQPSPEKLPPATAKAPTPPGKYSFRVSQCLFLADFEVNHDLPLFRELASLRDQVY